ncbi:unnamed protein product [Rotaria sordida]|uniref:Uncharacterized protein n=2 Tax=Rotaria sordida TaxID=392033 RepID=A0A820E5Y2_9BILA|nr:unnamed protein product [Rotaria sordida]
MDFKHTKSNKSSDTNISEKLTIFDECNNELIFIKKADNSVTFEYKPMDPLHSCSGEYSGGTPVFKNLESSEWIKLITAYQRAKTEGKLSQERFKGTLLLNLACYVRESDL